MFEAGSPPSAFCPYTNYVPKGAKVGPGCMIVCRCCGEEGDHHGDYDWVGRAISRWCLMQEHLRSSLRLVRDK
ncbi:hypothetical protein Pyn_23116 [Prunus yedoensis var. nudiflora]|uniref:Uncharacterized protein n=1 Tax=Prunus yedoensis var. nudiflora TaxID=2094558 RepID=A0A314YAG6_PRUYE|nr:hypothetical protein Pyn_23116 [Prunus yedoensis var. nudiflora]